MKQYAEPQTKVSHALQARNYPIKPNEEFLSVFDPAKWQFIEIGGEHKWVPLLNDQPLKRGAGGITGDANSRDASMFLARAHRQGCVEIRPDDPRLGEYRNYVRFVPCQKGRKVGIYHFSMWQSLDVLGGITRVTTDTQAYRRFLLYLVEKQIVPAMSAVVLQVRLEQLDRRIRGLIERAAQNPHLSAKVKESQEQRRRMPLVWAVQFGSDVARAEALRELGGDASIRATPEQAKQIEAMRAVGLADDAIGRALGLPAAAVDAVKASPKKKRGRPPKKDAAAEEAPATEDTAKGDDDAPTP